MKFRELFERYINKKASPQEVEIVENEIEKNEIINDYLADSIDKSFLKDNGSCDEDSYSESYNFTDNSNTEILESIQRAINKKFRRVALYSVIAVFSFFLVLRFAVSPLVNKVYYNPSQILGQFSNKFFVDIAVFTELHFPGILTISNTSEPLGFGSYNFRISQSNTFRNYNQIYEGKLERGKMKYMQPDFYQYAILNVFRYGVYPFQDATPNGDSIDVKELGAMPDSANAKVYVSFKEDMTMADLSSLIKEYNGLYFSWVGVRNSPKDIQRLPQFGFEPTGQGIFMLKGTVDDEKYPYFEIGYGSSPFAEDVMETHFKSLVKLLEIVKTF
nr:anti sigma factor C-terminal domain-containing protein [Clostridium sp.]MBK5235886.1 anti sigma factor C-terminal domain-containing protein [Clostridium sp.]